MGFIVVVAVSLAVQWLRYGMCSAFGATYTFMINVEDIWNFVRTVSCIEYSCLIIADPNNELLPSE